MKFLFGGTATMVCMTTISWIHDVLVGGSGRGLLRLVAVVVYNSLSSTIARSLSLHSGNRSLVEQRRDRSRMYHYYCYHYVSLVISTGVLYFDCNRFRCCSCCCGCYCHCEWWWWRSEVVYTHVHRLRRVWCYHGITRQYHHQFVMMLSHCMCYGITIDYSWN